MKELVRAHGREHRQLELAHDFRACVSGNPRIIRRQLRQYHLLEMPEEWNQLSFDDHVHDANTKGRKSSSHLIMDAWIKGIRRVRVIYYNCLEARFAVEILEAARIMGIDIRIGIEFFARFRNRYIQLIWVPRGFSDAQDFLCFLEESPVKDLMGEGKQVCRYQKEHVLRVLEAFNTIHGPAIQKGLGVAVPLLDTSGIPLFCGNGATLPHPSGGVCTCQNVAPHGFQGANPSGTVSESASRGTPQYRAGGANPQWNGFRYHPGTIPAI